MEDIMNVNAQRSTRKETRHGTTVGSCMCGGPLTGLAHQNSPVLKISSRSYSEMRPTMPMTLVISLILRDMLTF